MTSTLRRCLSIVALAALGASIGGCPNNVTPGDASDVSRLDGSDDSFDAPDADASELDSGDVPRVSTCSELRLESVSASPGSSATAYPGSVLALTGIGFTPVSRVVIGGIEMPFTRASDTSITTSVPAMLATGERTVIVQTDRCSSAQTIVISRLVAAIRTNASDAQLFDAQSLSPLGTAPLGSNDVAQAQFTLDGASLVTRDSSGTVRRTQIGSARVDEISPASSGPFVMAQGNVQPTRALLVVPGRVPPGVLSYDSLTGATAPYAAPAADPLSLALSLDGFRGLVLDHDGTVYRGELVFAPSATWTRITTSGPIAGATSVILSAAMNTLAEHLGAVFIGGATPSLVPVNVFSGETGAAVSLPAGASRPRFLSGDVVVMDTVTPEITACDITALEAVIWHVPLEGEPGGPEVATRTALSLYNLAAVVLSAGSDGVARGHTIHFVDFQVEPPVERARAEIADARGLVGMQGAGNPFVVWTGSGLVRVLGETPDVAHQATAAVAGVTGVAVQP